MPADNRPPFNGERFLTDRELSETLKDQPQVPAGLTGTKDGFSISSSVGRSCTGSRTSRSCWRRIITLHWYNIVFKFKDCRRNCIYDSGGNPYLVGGFLAGRIRGLSSFHQPVHVRGYLPVGDLGVDLRAVDVCMAHHPGDALYRNTRGQRQGPERMPGHMVDRFSLIPSATPIPAPRTRGRRGQAAGIPALPVIRGVVKPSICSATGAAG